MNTSQLLLVSSLGLGVNLFGMFAMGGHHHVSSYPSMCNEATLNPVYRAATLTPMAMAIVMHRLPPPLLCRWYTTTVMIMATATIRDTTMAMNMNMLTVTMQALSTLMTTDIHTLIHTVLAVIATSMPIPKPSHTPPTILIPTRTLIRHPTPTHLQLTITHIHTRIPLPFLKIPTPTPIPTPLPQPQGLVYTLATSRWRSKSHHLRRNCYTRHTRGYRLKPSL